MPTKIYCHMTIEVSGNTMPSLFADKVVEAFPDKLELENLRAASVPAELPITFRLVKDKVSDPQNYLTISYSDHPALDNR